MSWVEELLYPRRCPVCRDVVTPWGGWICDTCRDKMQPEDKACCMKCGRLLQAEEEEYCRDCTGKKRSFIRSIAGYDYRKPQVREMILQVKYHNERQLLDYPCLRMAQYYCDTVRAWRCQCLIPVPLHPRKRRRRGFNQASEIARRLSAVWGLPVEEKLLRRVKMTTPQKELDAAARLSNLLSAFEADTGSAPGLQQVILVDDICTTGATLEVCARALKSAGIRRVYGAVLAAGRD